MLMAYDRNKKVRWKEMGSDLFSKSYSKTRQKSQSGLAKQPTSVLSTFLVKRKHSLRVRKYILLISNIWDII